MLQDDVLAEASVLSAVTRGSHAKTRGNQYAEVRVQNVRSTASRAMTIDTDRCPPLRQPCFVVDSSCGAETVQAVSGQESGLGVSRNP